MNFQIFHALTNYSQDALFELLLFLSPVDCCKLGQTSHSLRHITNDEKLWMIYCKTRIEGFKEYIQSNDQLTAIQMLLQFPNHRKLFQAMQSLQFPLFGWFRVIPQDLTNCEGGLYCIYPTNGRVICQYVDYHGQGHMDDRSVDIIYDNRSSQVISRCFNSAKIYKTKFDDAIHLQHPHLLNERLSFKPLPPILSPTIANNAKSWENFFSSIGLFTSRYGSHGIEILHLSLHSTEDDSALRFNNYQFGGLQLQALKITGDRNVPAGKYSFCIDLLNTIDLHVPFVQDTRPIIIFPPDRDNPVLTNWEQRIPAMQFCARGLGQINRVPGVWNPEWVRCGFVLYKMPIGDQRAMFSIIWDDENDNFRHAMDFRVLPEGNMGVIDNTSSYSSDGR